MSTTIDPKKQSVPTTTTALATPAPQAQQGATQGAWTPNQVVPAKSLGLLDGSSNFQSTSAASGATSGAPTTTQVSAGSDPKVDQALNQIEQAYFGGGGTPGWLKAYLGQSAASGGLTDAEKESLIQKLAKDPSMAGALLGEQGKNSLPFAGQTDASTQQLIGSWIGKAFKAGFITGNDLMTIATSASRGAGPGSVELVAELAMDKSNCEPGGPVEALGSSLLGRAGGLDAKDSDQQKADYLAWAMAMTSSPDLINQDLVPNGSPYGGGVPDYSDLHMAFKYLSNSCDGSILSNIVQPSITSAWNQQILAGATRLFKMDGPELVHSIVQTKVTGSSEDYGQMKRGLTEFMSQAMFNPNNNGVTVDGQSIHDAVQQGLQTVSSGYMHQFKDATTDDQRTAASTELGRVMGYVSEGAHLAVSSYAQQIQANQQSITNWTNLVAGTIGALGGLGGGAPGALAAYGFGVEAASLAGQIANQLSVGSSKPPGNLSSVDDSVTQFRSDFDNWVQKETSSGSNHDVYSNDFDNSWNDEKTHIEAQVYEDGSTGASAPWFQGGQSQGP